MPNMKSKRRTMMHRVRRHTKLPLPICAKLAKMIVGGDPGIDIDAFLYKVEGLSFVRSYGCECCDPHSTKVFSYKGHEFRTEYGEIDLPRVMLPKVVKLTPAPIVKSKPKVCRAYNPTGICDGEPICGFCGG